MKPRAVLTIICGAVLLAVLVPSAWAELTPGQVNSANALIAQFGDRQFTARQKAVAKLVDMGPDVLPIVRKTLADTDDNEVKLRCRLTFEGIARKFGVIIPELQTERLPKNLSWDPSRVTIKEKGISVAEAFELLASHTGNRPFSGLSANVKDKQIDLDIKDMIYWKAVDVVCKHAGVTYQTGYNKETFRFYATNNTKELDTHTGPIVVKLAKCSRDHSQWLGFRYGSESGEQETLTFSLAVYIEDRLPVVASSGKLMKVLTADGKNVMTAVPRSRWAPGWFRVSQYMRHAGAFSVTVPDSPQRVGTPVAIEGYIDLETGVGRKQLRLDDLLAKKSASADNITITMVGTKREKNEITVTLAVQSDCHVPMILAHSRSLSYGFALVDPTGKVHKVMTNYSWQGEQLRSAGRVPPGYRLDQERGKAIDGVLSMTFKGVPLAVGRWSLVYSYPEKSHTRRFPFKLENVPVP